MNSYFNMKYIKSSFFDSLKIRVREQLNPIMGPLRRKRIKGKYPFTVISNNCWGGHFYRYFNLPYDSPTIGLYFFASDYIQFIYNIKYYINECSLKFISIADSAYREELYRRGGKNLTCPIGVLDDIEIVFLHYKTKEEAYEKWTRRCRRIHWNRMYYKMSEQNLCTHEDLAAFDKFPSDCKFVFVCKDYQLKNQVFCDEWKDEDEVSNDTIHFRKYINCVNWINSKPFKRRQTL